MVSLLETALARLSADVTVYSVVGSLVVRPGWSWCVVVAVSSECAVVVSCEKGPCYAVCVVLVCLADSSVVADVAVGCY